MKTIRRYVAVQIFWSTALVFTALLLLFGFFDFIQELGEIGRGGYRLSLAALYVLLSLPGRAPPRRQRFTRQTSFRKIAPR